ncbi:MAG: T9SS type A sorting domain-containing protein [Chitinophagales bacterium]
MNKIYTLILLLTVTHLSIQAQLFIDNGTNGIIYIGNVSGGTPGSYDNTGAGITLFVDGDITNEGTYDDQSSELQLTGNLTNSGTFTTTGDIVFVSAPNATITTSINQRISGIFTGTNDFYNLITQKNATQYVDLTNNIEVENILKFNNSGRIRTDVAGHTNDGSAYPYEIYLRNGSTSSLVGHSTGNGATEKYIEGRLRRKATSTGIYYYPIGVAPNYLDGMESFELNFTANPNMDFVGYLKPGTQAPLNRNILCDVGKDPGIGSQQFPGCSGTPDGIFDWYYLEAPMDLSHEWIVTPSGSTSGYNYGITLHPGNLLDVNNAANYYTIPAGCGAPYQTQRLRVVAKNGVIGGSQQVGPGNWAPWGHISAYIWCQFDNADLDISLNSQTSFSTFRIHGTSISSNTALPVELVELKATPVNNDYIRVSWTTASELNNQGFEIFRSADGTNFSSIGYVNGNGNSNQVHQYSFDDRNTQTGITYYYKLKQIDFNSAYKYTYIVSANLTPSDKFTINDIYPNPTTSASYVNIYSPTQNTLSYSMYNELGQEINTQKVELEKGYNTIALSSSALAKGTYIVSFLYEDRHYYKKAMKQ